MLKLLMRDLVSLLNKSLLVLIIIILGIVFESSTKEQVKYLPAPVNKVSTSDTLEEIYQEILTLKLDHPEIVFSQVILETGYLSSKLFQTHNNLFGMRVSGSRATTSTTIVNGYKYYSHWRESLVDYALLQMAFYRNKTKEEYYQKLERAYAEDPLYTDKLKYIEQQLKDPAS